MYMPQKIKILKFQCNHASFLIMFFYPKSVSNR